MRFRVSEFQKVLNRAKAEVAQTERKTVRCVCFYMFLSMRDDADLCAQRKDIGHSIGD